MENKAWARRLALIKMLITQYLYWYTLIASAPMMAGTFIFTLQGKFFFGHQLSSTIAVIIWFILSVAAGIFTIIWFKQVYAEELKLGCDLNPFMRELMENTKK